MFNVIELPKVSRGGGRGADLTDAERAHLDALVSDVMKLHESPGSAGKAVRYVTTSGTDRFDEREAKSINAKLRRRLDSINAPQVRTRATDALGNGWAVVAFYGAPPANASI